MVCSAETTAVMNVAAEQGGSRGAASELLQSQLELMEAHGFDRRFGEPSPAPSPSPSPSPSP